MLCCAESCHGHTRQIRAQHKMVAMLTEWPLRVAARPAGWPLQGFSEPSEIDSSVTAAGALCAMASATPLVSIWDVVCLSLTMHQPVYLDAACSFFAWNFFLSHWYIQA